MVTGKKPFVEDERRSAMHKIRLEKHVGARRLNPEIPRELERIIDRCLEKQPRDRWRSAQHMVMALERFLAKHVEMNHHARLVLFLRSQNVITELEAEEYLNPAALGGASALQQPNMQARHVVRAGLVAHAIALGVLALMLGLIHVAPLSATPAYSAVREAGHGYLRISASPWARISDRRRAVRPDPARQADRPQGGPALGPAGARLVPAGRALGRDRRGHRHRAPGRVGRLRRRADPGRAGQDASDRRTGRHRRRAVTAAPGRAAGAWLAAAAALAALCALPPAARAQAQDASRPVLYRVRQGDTLDLIAAEFYGDRAKAVFIAAENKLARPRALKPGERLRIPVGREITTSPNDTFESLAMTYLGSARRGAFLADWAGLSHDDSLPAGTAIAIPFTIAHVAQSTESLADIARTYFGDARNAEMLRHYNQLEKASVDRGDTVLVPAFHVRMNPARQPALDAESRARRDHRREAQARAARALPAARLAWKAGDFEAVRGELSKLEPDLDYLDAADAVDIAVLLGAAHVAFDETEPALACFKRALDRQAQHALRRYDHSPKVLAVWQKAGGPIE